MMLRRKLAVIAFLFRCEGAAVEEETFVVSYQTNDGKFCFSERHSYERGPALGWRAIATNVEKLQ
jgi:hypothetical protein